MATGILEKDLIPQSHLWKMGLGIEARSLEVVLFPPVASEPIIHRSIALDPTATPLKAVEDAVYENPLLLSEFRETVCVAGSEKFMVVPPEVAADATLRRSAFGTLNPADDGQVLLDFETAARNASVVAGIDQDMYGFLKRSFYNTGFSQPMVALINHVCWLSGDADGAVMMLVRFRDEKIDLVCAQGDKLLLANSFRITAPIDAAYYILATRKNLGIAPDGALRLAGPVEQRRHAADILRPYLSDVADLPLPSRLWQSGAPALTAPLDLLLLPLSCA